MLDVTTTNSTSARSASNGNASLCNRRSRSAAPPPNLAMPVAKAKKSELQDLIADHFRALRVSRRAEKKLAALVAKYPDLEHRRPLVEMFTRITDGSKVYGRWTDDFDEVFPPSMNKISHSTVALREAFIERAKAGAIEQKKRREDAGIEQAEAVAGPARGDVCRAFRRLKEYSPKTIEEVRLLVRHVIKALPEHVGGPIFQIPIDDKARRACYARRSTAFFDVEVLLRSLTKDPQS